MKSPQFVCFGSLSLELQTARPEAERREKEFEWLGSDAAKPA